MKCPFCNHPDTQVVETREAEDGGFIRRRRQCEPGKQRKDQIDQQPRR